MELPVPFEDPHRDVRVNCEGRPDAPKSVLAAVPAGAQWATEGTEIPIDLPYPEPTLYFRQLCRT